MSMPMCGGNNIFENSLRNEEKRKKKMKSRSFKFEPDLSFANLPLEVRDPDTCFCLFIKIPSFLP